MEYVLDGAGAPAVVLVNGAGGPLDSWFRVFEPLAQSATVFAYNRAGVGASSKPAEPQTGDVLVRELRELLAAAGVEPPYVLVGHSLGGLVANLYARLHPDEVAGMVLLDATAPDDVAAMAAHENGFQRLVRKALDAVLGKNPLGETECAACTVELIGEAGPFPPIPLVVVTGGKPAMRWATPAQAIAARAAHQRALAALSPLGRQVMAAASGHFPQFSEPALVIDAVREVAAKVRHVEVIRCAGD